MVSVGKSVQAALEAFGTDDDIAMLHACHAVDATARKVYPRQGVRDRFETLLRDKFVILETFGVQGIDVIGTRYDVRLKKTSKPRSVDLAEIIYKMHRTYQAHGDETPEGWELVPTGEDGIVRTRWVVDETIQLPASIIIGMLAISILNPVNNDQRARDTAYIYTVRGDRTKTELTVNDWWGREAEFVETIVDPNRIRVTIDPNTEARNRVPPSERTESVTLRIGDVGEPG